MKAHAGRPDSTTTVAAGVCAVVVLLIPGPAPATGAPVPFVAGAGALVLSHHSLAGMYDSSKRVTVDGVVSEFHFVNPHPFLLVDVTDRRGRSESWHLEMDNRRELASIGVEDNTFKVGDRVVASGSPGRSQSRILYVWKLERPSDGLEYEQIGASPHIRIPGRD